jgi:hypothetical protein
VYSVICTAVGHDVFSVHWLRVFFFFLSFFLVLTLRNRFGLPTHREGGGVQCRAPIYSLALCSFLHSSWALMLQESRKEGEPPRGE